MRRSIYWSLLDQPSTNTWPTCRSTVDPELTNVSVELPLMSAEVSTVTISGAYRSTTGGISVNYRRNVGHVSFDIRAKVYQYYLPIYRPILSVILDTLHQYIARYLILSTDVSTDVSTNVSADTSTDTRAFIDRSSVDHCIKQCIDRYQPIHSVKVKCWWSISAVSVKYRWSLSEPPSMSTDRSIGRYISRYSADISIYTQSSIDRYSIEYRPMYRAIYRRIRRSRPPIRYMIQICYVNSSCKF